MDSAEAWQGRCLVAEGSVEGKAQWFLFLKAFPDLVEGMKMKLPFVGFQEIVS
ncbi:MAG: hypothetical protein IMZ50_12460 [Candidatus Atribacteria bacterium]|nr:hypothetical protein [Candidatus Atribacteria bacterium]